MRWRRVSSLRGGLRRSPLLVRPFVWATVVRAERPTSAKPGDSALVLADGQVDGFVGGDCAESTVRVQAMEVLGTGTPRLVRITPSPDDLGSDDLG